LEIDSGIDVVRYFARSSIAALDQPPVSYDPSDLDQLDASGFERRCLTADLEKTSIESIAHSSADILIVDIIDERFRVLRCGDSYVTESPTFVRAQKLSSKLNDATKIDSRDRQALWGKGLQALNLAFARKGPKHRFVHDAPWAMQFIDPKLGVTPFPDKMREKILDANQKKSLMIEQLAIALDAKVVRVPLQFVFAASDHKWGLAPFHYTHDYYTRFMRQLRSLITD